MGLVGPLSVKKSLAELRVLLLLVRHHVPDYWETRRGRFVSYPPHIG